MTDENSHIAPQRSRSRRVRPTRVGVTGTRQSIQRPHGKRSPHTRGGNRLWCTTRRCSSYVRPTHVGVLEERNTHAQ